MIFLVGNIFGCYCIHYASSKTYNIQKQPI